MPADVLVPLTLVRGDEEFLRVRASQEVIAAARREADEVEIRQLSALSVEPGDLLDLLSPSLFGDQRVLVLEDLPELDFALAEMLAGHGRHPVEGIRVVAVHSGGVKGKKVVDLIAGAAQRVVECTRLKPQERRGFVAEELRRGGVRPQEEVVDALLDAVGPDLRELAAACQQLIADTAGAVDTAAVARYHRGRGKVDAFGIADRALDGDVAGALEELRWGLTTGLAPVLVTSTVASALRTLGQVAGAGRGSGAAAAKALGLPPWKVDKARRQLRRWDPAGLAGALLAAADADAEVKGAGADAEYAVERLVLTVATAARGR